MELNYIKEHTSCVNYKTEEYSGFSLGQALTGENFDNQEPGDKSQPPDIYIVWRGRNYQR